MPSAAPLALPTVATQLGEIGQHIRACRKALRVSALAAAEAAGMSRVTLHRIERGEASVTMGAYLNAMAALGLALDVTAIRQSGQHQAAPSPEARPGAEVLPSQPIRLSDYPQLKRLAWSIPGAVELTPHEALSLYERNWRHLDKAQMTPRETALLDSLVRSLGKGHLLV